jgi:nucleolar protein 14
MKTKSKKQQKRPATQAKPNPFELKFNKQKHAVLNRGVAKKGRPLQRNQKELTSRMKQTEMLNQRENLLVDKRIGKNLSKEEQNLKRFMKLRQKQTLFNLNDDDDQELTHFGKSLDDVAPVTLSDSEDEDGYKLDDHNFGGFEAENSDKKSRNEVMKEIIAKSKAHRKERQMIKEHNLEIIDEIDQELDDIRGLLAPIKGSEAETAIEPKVDEYDTFVREMQFDRRAKPTDRIKSEQELAIEAKEELERLEALRIKRMNGVDDSEEDEPRSQKRKAIADDLDDDDYITERDGQIASEQIQPLTYKDGVLVNTEIFMKPKKDSDTTDSEDDDDEEEDSEVEEEEAEVDDEEEEEDADEGEVEENASDEDNDSELDGAIENVGDDLDAGQVEYSGTDSESNPESIDSDYELLKEMAEEEVEESNAVKIAKKQKLVEEAASEVPYVLDAPSNYEEFQALMENRTMEEQIIVLNRLRILYSTKISSENKPKMQKLMVNILRHIITIASETAELSTLEKLSEHLIPLCREFPSHFSKWCQSRITFLSEKFSKNFTKKLKSSLFPCPGDLFLFRELSRFL